MTYHELVSFVILFRLAVDRERRKHEIIVPLDVDQMVAQNDCSRNRGENWAPKSRQVLRFCNLTCSKLLVCLPKRIALCTFKRLTSLMALPPSGED